MSIQSFRPCLKPASSPTLATGKEWMLFKSPSLPSTNPGSPLQALVCSESLPWVPSCLVPRDHHLPSFLLSEFCSRETGASSVFVGHEAARAFNPSLLTDHLPWSLDAKPLAGRDLISGTELQKAGRAARVVAQSYRDTWHS